MVTGMETRRLGRVATEREWEREAAQSAVRLCELSWANGEPVLTQINNHTTMRAANATGPRPRRRMSLVAAVGRRRDENSTASCATRSASECGGAKERYAAPLSKDIALALHSCLITRQSCHLGSQLDPPFKFDEYSTQLIEIIVLVILK